MRGIIILNSRKSGNGANKRWRRDPRMGVRWCYRGPNEENVLITLVNVREAWYWGSSSPFLMAGEDKHFPFSCTIFLFLLTIARLLCQTRKGKRNFRIMHKSERVFNMISATECASPGTTAFQKHKSDHLLLARRISHLSPQGGRKGRLGAVEQKFFSHFFYS